MLRKWLLTSLLFGLHTIYCLEDDDQESPDNADLYDDQDDEAIHQDPIVAQPRQPAFMTGQRQGRSRGVRGRSVGDRGSRNMSALQTSQPESDARAQHKVMSAFMKNFSRNMRLTVLSDSKGDMDEDKRQRLMREIREEQARDDAGDQPLEEQQYEEARLRPHRALKAPRREAQHKPQLRLLNMPPPSMQEMMSEQQKGATKGSSTTSSPKIKPVRLLNMSSKRSSRSGSGGKSKRKGSVTAFHRNPNKPHALGDEPVEVVRMKGEERSTQARIAAVQIEADDDDDLTRAEIRALQQKRREQIESQRSTLSRWWYNAVNLFRRAPYDPRKVREQQMHMEDERYKRNKGEREKKTHTQNGEDFAYEEPHTSWWQFLENFFISVKVFLI